MPNNTQPGHDLRESSFSWVTGSPILPNRMVDDPKDPPKRPQAPRALPKNERGFALTPEGRAPTLFDVTMAELESPSHVVDPDVIVRAAMSDVMAAYRRSVTSERTGQSVPADVALQQSLENWGSIDQEGWNPAAYQMTRGTYDRIRQSLSDEYGELISAAIRDHYFARRGPVDRAAARFDGNAPEETNLANLGPEALSVYMQTRAALAADSQEYDLRGDFRRLVSNALAHVSHSTEDVVQTIAEAVELQSENQLGYSPFGMGGENRVQLNRALRQQQWEINKPEYVYEGGAARVLEHGIYGAGDMAGPVLATWALMAVLGPGAGTNLWAGMGGRATQVAGQIMSIANGAIGARVAATALWTEIEFPDTYQQLQSLGVDNQLAFGGAMVASVAKAWIEQDQISRLLPGGGKSLSEAFARGIIRGIARFAAQAGRTYTEEMLEEVVQAGIDYGINEVVAYMDDNALWDDEARLQFVENQAVGLRDAAVSMVFLMGYGQASTLVQGAYEGRMARQDAMALLQGAVDAAEAAGQEVPEQVRETLARNEQDIDLEDATVQPQAEAEGVSTQNEPELPDQGPGESAEQAPSAPQEPTAAPGATISDEAAPESVSANEQAQEAQTVENRGPITEEEYREALERTRQRRAQAEQTEEVEASRVDTGAQVDTIAGRMSLDEFESKGYSPDEVTREDWVNLQRANRRALGQDETSGTQNAPFADYESYHEQEVRRAVESGDEVDPRILADYPSMFEVAYRRTLDTYLSYPPDQVGSQIYASKMADFQDAAPDLVEQIDAYLEETHKAGDAAGDQQEQAKPTPEATSVQSIPEQARLRSPVRGPTGAQIVGYTWRSKSGEKWSDYEGGIVEGQVSDWDDPATSEGTGRQIVHEYYVQHPDGRITTEGINSAQNILGLQDSKIRSIAKSERDRRRGIARRNEGIVRDIENNSFDSAAEANRAYRLSQPKSMSTADAEQNFNDATLMQKGGRYRRVLGDDYVQMLTDAGWEQSTPEAGEAAKSALDRVYGGIPSNGGYDANTEYEIGAARIAEAAHCILGSCGKHMSDPSGLAVEEGHIREELGIIERSVAEYSKPLYIERVWRPESEYAQKSIESIRETSPVLHRQATEMRKSLSNFEGDPRRREIADNAYDVLAKLSYAMGQSIPDGNATRPSRNGIADPRLQGAVHNLSVAVERAFLKKSEADTEAGEKISDAHQRYLESKEQEFDRSAEQSGTPKEEFHGYPPRLPDSLGINQAIDYIKVAWPEFASARRTKKALREWLESGDFKLGSGEFDVEYNAGLKTPSGRGRAPVRYSKWQRQEIDAAIAKEAAPAEGAVLATDRIQTPWRDHGRYVITKSARSRGMVQVTHFSPEGVPTGHTEHNNIIDALREYGNELGLPELNIADDRAATAYLDAATDESIADLVEGKEFVYVSLLRPLNGVSVDGFAWTSKDGRTGVLFSDAPLSIDKVKHLSLIVASPEARDAYFNEYIKENWTEEVAESDTEPETQGTAKQGQRDRVRGEMLESIPNASEEMIDAQLQVIDAFLNGLVEDGKIGSTDEAYATLHVVSDEVSGGVTLKQADTDLFGNPVAKKGFGNKQSDLFDVKAELAEVMPPRPNAEAKRELIRAIVPIISAAKAPKDAKGVYLELRARLKADTDALFNNPTNWLPEMEDAYERSTKGERLFQTTTNSFRAWFGDSKVVDENGDPLRVYHGTTHEFTVFEKSRGNIESDFGVGFYFSNTPDDVAKNYAGEGPDLTNRIEIYVDRLMGDPDAESEFHRLRVNGEIDDYGFENWARDRAYEELVGGPGHMVPAYLSIQNPVIIGKDANGQQMYVEPISIYNEDDLDSLRGEAEERVRERYGLDEGDDLDDFENEVRLEQEELADENGYYNDSPHPVIEAVNRVAASLDAVDDIGKYNLSEILLDGITYEKLADYLKTEVFRYATDPSTGDLVTGEAARRVFEELGFDGIIDYTVNKKFGSERRVGQSMEGMHEGTVHYVAFKPTQIKSAIGNRGTFDPQNPDIVFQANKGSITFFPNNEAFIHATKASDASTVAHELAHWIRRIASKHYADEMAVIEKHFRVKDGVWTRKKEERFARSWERYLRDGKAPTSKLREAFETLKRLLNRIYESLKDVLVRGRRQANPLSLKGLGINQHQWEEIRAVFDRWLGSKRTIEDAKALRKERKEAKLADSQADELADRLLDWYADVTGETVDGYYEEAHGGLEEGRDGQYAVEAFDGNFAGELPGEIQDRLAGMGKGEQLRLRRYIKSNVPGGMAEDFVGQLPGGYDEFIERAKRLSGGRKAARAAVLNRALTLAKDAANAGDYETSAMVEAYEQTAIDQSPIEDIEAFISQRADELMQSSPEGFNEYADLSDVGELDQLGNPDILFQKRIISESAYQKSRKNLENNTNLYSGLPVQELKDYTVIGLYHFENLIRNVGIGAAKFTRWTAEMIEDVGEHVRPFLHTIWRRTKAQRNRIIKTDKSVSQAQRAARRNVKARIRENTTVPDGESVLATPRQLLKWAMKKAEIASAKAYLAGARDVVATHKGLGDYAREMLPKEYQSRTHKAIEKARTPAEIRACVAGINMLHEMVRRKAAMAAFRKAKVDLDLKHMRPAERAKAQALLDAITETAPSDVALEKALALHDAIRDYDQDVQTIDGSKTLMELEVPDVVIERMKDTLARAGRTPLTSMTVESIDLITLSLKHIKWLSEKKNKLLARGKQRTNQEVAAEATAEVAALTRKAKTPAEKTRTPYRFGAGLLNYEAKIEYIVGHDGTGAEVLLKTLRDGQNTQLQIIQEAEQAIRPAMKGIDIGAWLPEDAGTLRRAFRRMTGRSATKTETVSVTFPDARYNTGEKVGTLEMDHGARMELFLLFNDGFARRSILADQSLGVTIASDRRVLAFTMTAKDMEVFMNSITEKEWAIASAMSKYLNGPLKDDWLNPAWVDQKGYEIAMRNDHWPIRRSMEFSPAEPDKFIAHWGEAQLDQQRMFKDRTGSRKPIIIGNAFETFYNQINAVSAFVGKHAPLLDALRLLHDPKFRQAVRARVKHADFWLRDLEDTLRWYRGLDKRDESVYSKAVSKFLKGFHIAAVGGKPHIMLYQTVSYAMAINEIKARFLANPKHWRHAGNKKINAEIEAHSPVLVARREGGGHQIISAGVAGGEMIRFYTGKNASFSERLAMGGIQYCDWAVIVNLWQAVKAETKALHPELTGEKYWAHVARRTQQVVDRTQPTWDALSISGLTRDAYRNPALRLLTIFTSQRAKNLNMMARAYVEFEQSDRKIMDWVRFIRKAKTPTLINAALINGLRVLSWWAYNGGKDDDEEGNFLAELLVISLGNVQILGGVLAWGLIKQWNKYTGQNVYAPMPESSIWGVLEQGADALEGAFDAVEYYRSGAVFDSGWNKGQPMWRPEALRALRQSMMPLGTMLRLPLPGAYRLLDAGYKWGTRDSIPEAHPDYLAGTLADAISIPSSYADWEGAIEYRANARARLEYFGVTDRDQMIELLQHNYPHRDGSQRRNYEDAVLRLDIMLGNADPSVQTAMIAGHLGKDWTHPEEHIDDIRGTIRVLRDRGVTSVDEAIEMIEADLDRRGSNSDYRAAAVANVRARWQQYAD